MPRDSTPPVGLDLKRPWRADNLDDLTRSRAGARGFSTLRLGYLESSSRVPCPASAADTHSSSVSQAHCAYGLGMEGNDRGRQCVVTVLGRRHRWTLKDLCQHQLPFRRSLFVWAHGLSFAGWFHSVIHSFVRLRTETGSDQGLGRPCDLSHVPAISFPMCSAMATSLYSLMSHLASSFWSFGLYLRLVSRSLLISLLYLIYW
jgi:hypothetical protein